MPDLSLALFGVTIIAVIGAVVFFLRKKKEDAPAPVVAPAPDVAALQAALKQAIDKLHASTPVTPAPVVVPVPAPAVTMAPDGTIPVGTTTTVIGTTSPTWKAPPPPWPIDARYLNANQIAALTAEETGRANMWQQALMSATMTGNGQNPVPAALMIYRAGMTPTDQINAPLSPDWVKIFATYGVPVPTPDARVWTGNPSSPRPSDAAYDVRLQQ